MRTKYWPWDEQGELNEQDPAYHRYDKDYGKKLPADIKRFIVTAAIMVSVMTGIVWLSHLVRRGKHLLSAALFHEKRNEGHREGAQIQDTSLAPGRYNR